MADTFQLSQLRTYLEGLTHTENDSNYAGTTVELQDLNRGYLKTAYRFNWPQTLKRYADAVVSQVDRYSLQSDFRKFLFMRQQGVRLDATDIDHIYENASNCYAVTLDSNEYIVGNLPNTASTVYTFSGSYSAGSAVIITLASVDGISAGDEIFISDGANTEFSKVQSVDSTNLTITCKLANAHSNKTLYRVAELNYFQYQKQVTPLSASGDIPVTPGETHLAICEYAAGLYYNRIEEPDRGAFHMANWLDETNDAWLAWGKNIAGEIAEMTIE